MRRTFANADMRSRIAFVALLQVGFGVAVGLILLLRAPTETPSESVRLACLMVCGSALIGAVGLRLMEGGMDGLFASIFAEAPAGEVELFLPVTEEKLLPAGLHEAAQHAEVARDVAGFVARQSEQAETLARAAAVAEGSAEVLAADVESLVASINSTSARILGNARHASGATDAMRRTRDAVIRLTAGSKAMSADLTAIGDLARRSRGAGQAGAALDGIAADLCGTADDVAAQLAAMAEATSAAQYACADIAAAVTRMAQDTASIASESEQQLDQFAALSARVQALAAGAGAMRVQASSMADAGDSAARAVAAAEAACEYVSRVAAAMPKAPAARPAAPRTAVA